MSRPTDDASFATDATLTGGGQMGLATRLRPADALRAQGFYEDRRIPARILSWLLGHLGDWIAYLDNFVKVLDQGGTLLPTDNVNLLNSTGKTANINGTVFQSYADGGGVTMTGAGDLTIAGGVTSGNNGMHTTGVLTASRGWVPRRITVESLNLGRTVAVSSTDVYILPASLWSTSRQLILSGTGAVSGVSEIEVFNYDTLNAIDVVNGPTSTSLTSVPASGPGVATRKRYIFIGTNWQLLY